MTNTFALKDANILPVEYNYDIEAELRQIKFSKNVAEKQENYEFSLKKGNQHRTQIEVQRSVKFGIAQFFKNKDQVINLGLSMLLWFLTVMSY